MSRAVANTLLPAARPASTIARPRPRELPVTNHICAIHPPRSSHPPDNSREASQTQDWMRNGYTKGLVSALLKIRAPHLSNPSKPTEKELIGAKNWKILMRRNSDRRPVSRQGTGPGEIDLTPAIPNLINQC